MLENRINQLELATQRVEAQVTQLVKDFAELREKVDMILDKVDDHQAQLYGENGKPGLVGQAGTLEELRVALKGYGREPGLIADIQALMKRMAGEEDTKRWIIRLIIGLIVTNLLTLLLK